MASPTPPQGLAHEPVPGPVSKFPLQNRPSHPPQEQRHERILTTTFAALTSLSVAAALTGCGLGTTATVTNPPVTAAAGVQGIFMGGQQPVGNVSIQIYAASTATYGGAATTLLTAGATKTTPSGNFTLPSFTCPSGSSELYLVGTGGQPIAAVGSTPAVTNNNLALMTALGTCTAFVNSSNFVNVNELTTVASVYALSGFMTGIANVGGPTSNPTGLTNAFATVNSIVNTTNGTLATAGGGNGSTIPTTLPANATLPTTLINTLGDIMEACINSSGGVHTDTSTSCGKLFANAPNAAGTYPTDTITAMLNIAQNPTKNVAALNSIRSASPAFQTALSVNSPPSAFTIGITYTAGLSAPSAVAVDSAGSIWVASKSNNSVVKLSPAGAVSSTVTSTIVAPTSIAIDTSGNAWVTNSTANTVSKIPSAGTSATSYTGSFSTPSSIAIDSNNQVWVTNTGNSTVSALSNSGAVVSGSPFSGGGLSTPVAVATSAK